MTSKKRATPGRCCSCGYNGAEETLCHERTDRTHCVHWWDAEDAAAGQPALSVSLGERRAVFIYEAARIEAIASERPIVPEPWEQRDLAFRSQCITTTERICANPDTTPEAEHDLWWRAYEAMGWRYGPVRDPVAKTHPDMVPFDALEPKEREKDAVFLALCRFAAEHIR